MAEGQTTKKRVRKPEGVKGGGIQYAGDWFVCSFCGDTSKHALVPVDVVKGVAFHSFPCALAWIEEKAPADKKRELLTAAKKLYGQPEEPTPTAPPKQDLLQFGGRLTVDEWLPNAELWRAHTELHGVDRTSLPSAKQRKKPAAPADSVVFEVGMYLIPYKGVPKAVAGDFTAPAVLRKVNKFAADHVAYAVHHFDTERYSVTACDSAAADPAHFNNLATQLAGSSVYGPALAIFTRKCSLKV